MGLQCQAPRSSTQDHRRVQRQAPRARAQDLVVARTELADSKRPSSQPRRKAVAMPERTAAAASTSTAGTEFDWPCPMPSGFAQSCVQLL